MMAEVHIQRGLPGDSAVHIALNHAVGRRRASILHRVACAPVLRVPGHPVGPGAVSSLGGTSHARCRPNKRSRRIDVERTENAQCVRAHVIRAQHPAGRQLPLYSESPLFVIGVYQRVGITKPPTIPLGLVSKKLSAPRCRKTHWFSLIARSKRSNSSQSL